MKTIQRILITILLLTFPAYSLSAETAAKPSKIEQAIERATNEKKMLFVWYGRETCGNCGNLDSLIKKKQLGLFDSEFIIVKINGSIVEEQTDFFDHYKLSLADKTNRIMPFVVIANSDGSMIAERRGFGDKEAYRKFINESKKKKN